MQPKVLSCPAWEAVKLIYIFCGVLGGKMCLHCAPACMSLRRLCATVALWWLLAVPARGLAWPCLTLPIPGGW